MGKETGIAWCHHTFNPWWGCVEVSPACDHCYARRFSDRLAAGAPSHWGQHAPRRFFADKHWNEPLKWNEKARELPAGERRLVFCASMADVFESGRDDLEPHRQRLWELIRITPNLTWLLLTKRPQNIGRMYPEAMRGAPHVWFGTTMESSAYYWRADALLEHAHHAPVRFLSMEPLIEQTSAALYLSLGEPHGVNWLITGCESGDGARDTPTDWFRLLRDECASARVPFLFKQALKGAEGIAVGTTSIEKRDLRSVPGSSLKKIFTIIERPYLDGRQHMEFPGA